MDSFKFLDTEIDTKMKFKKVTFIAIGIAFSMSLLGEYVPNTVKTFYMMTYVLIFIFGLVYTSRGLGLLTMAVLIVLLLLLISFDFVLPYFFS